MKNMQLLLIFSLICIVPIITKAETITNNNGIVITETEYNNFLKIYDHEYIMNMSEEKYNKLKSLNYDDVTTETKYIETTYNQSLNLVTTREITKAEFENYNPVMPLLDDGGNSYSTQVKSLTLNITGGTIWNYTVFIATWKGIPSTRSFDVIGLRGYGFEFALGSQGGEQIYTLNGEREIINYAWNGTNIKRFDDGFGISMNIVNSDITSLTLAIDCDIKATITHPSISGSYQHAIRNLSLADSQNYTLGVTGLGDVFVYPYSISQKYDGMSGVLVNY